MIKIGTPAFRRFIVDLLPASWTASCELKNIIDTMHHTSIEIYESKKRALASDNESGGKDIMSILSTFST